MGGDPHFRSAHQPIRVPGTVYRKAGVERIVTIRAQNPERELDLGDFAEASAAIGHFIRQVHEGRITPDEGWEAICGYNAACLRPTWPLERLKAEADAIWARHVTRNGPATLRAEAMPAEIASYPLGALLDDTSPMPDDLIRPRLLTPGGMLVLGGAPKVGKSDFLILGVLLDEAAEGRLYSIMQLAEKFENTLGLGSKHTIRERLSVLATKGFVKFRRDGSEFGLEVVRSRFGYLCVEGMTFGPDVETVDPETGEVTTCARRVLPSHFKCPQSGNCLDVENPEIWVYPQGVLDDLTPPENDLTPEELGLTPHSSRKIKS